MYSHFRSTINCSIFSKRQTTVFTWNWVIRTVTLLHINVLAPLFWPESPGWTFWHLFFTFAWRCRFNRSGFSVIVKRTNRTVAREILELKFWVTKLAKVLNGISGNDWRFVAPATVGSWYKTMKKTRLQPERADKQPETTDKPRYTVGHKTVQMFCTSGKMALYKFR